MNAKTEMPTSPKETSSLAPDKGVAAPTAQELHDKLHLRGGFYTTTNEVNELLLELLKIITKEG